MEKLTDLQVQAALVFLGYNPGAIDGIAGKNTNAALSAFASDYGLSDQTTDIIRGSLIAAIAGTIQPVEKTDSDSISPDAEDPSDPFYGIKYFHPAEFTCKCSGLCNKDTATMDHKLLTIDDKIRDHFGVPVTVTSGIRCTKHNYNVGGVSNSRHLTGHANDLVVSGFSASMVLAFVKTLSGVNYAYDIDGSAVHVDTI